MAILFVNVYETSPHFDSKWESMSLSEVIFLRKS